jgi:hypothetical protein
MIEYIGQFIGLGLLTIIIYLLVEEQVRKSKE